jgi:hypothetical protein
MLFSEVEILENHKQLPLVIIKHQEAAQFSSGSMSLDHEDFFINNYFDNNLKCIYNGTFLYIVLTYFLC